MDISVYKRKLEPQLQDWEIVQEIAQEPGDGSHGVVFRVMRARTGEPSADARLRVISVPRDGEERNEIAASRGEEAASYLQGLAKERERQVEELLTVRGRSILPCRWQKTISDADGLQWYILILTDLLEPAEDGQERFKGPAGEAEAARLGIDICNALETCENRGIVLADLRPGVILHSSDGYVLDAVGAAAARGEGKGAAGASRYAPPEERKDGVYDRTADIYSLGLILYRLLNGNRLPFFPPAGSPIRPQSREEADRKILSGMPFPAIPGVSAGLLTVIRKACAFRPEDRYQNAADFRKDLAGCLYGENQKADSNIWEDAGTTVHEDRRPDPVLVEDGMKSDAPGEEQDTGSKGAGEEQDTGRDADSDTGGEPDLHRKKRPARVVLPVLAAAAAAALAVTVLAVNRRSGTDPGSPGATEVSTESTTGETPAHTVRKTDTKETKEEEKQVSLEVSEEHTVLETYAKEHFRKNQYWVIQDTDDYALLILADTLYESTIGASKVTCYAVGADGEAAECGSIETSGSSFLVETDGDVLVSYIGSGGGSLREYRLNTDTGSLETVSRAAGKEAVQAHEEALAEGLHILDFGNLAWSSAYRDVIRDLEKQYGEDRIEYYPYADYREDSGLSDDYLCYRGLCFADLADMNGDGTPELVVSYDKGIEEGRYSYDTAIYSAENGKAELVFSGESGASGAPAVFLAALKAYPDGKVSYLQCGGPGYTEISLAADGSITSDDNPFREDPSGTQQYQYLFNETDPSDADAFALTERTMKETLYGLGLTYPEVTGPESDNPAYLYPALIQNLELRYGSPGIDVSAGTAYVGMDEQIYTGLCFLDFVDFDRDGTDELLTAYVREDAEKGTYTSEIVLYAIADGKPVQVWSGAPFVQGMPAVGRFYLTEYEGNTWLYDPVSVEEYQAVTIRGGKAVVYTQDSGIAEQFTSGLTSYELNSYYDSEGKGASEFMAVQEMTEKVLEKYHLDSENDFAVTRKESTGEEESAGTSGQGDTAGADTGTGVEDPLRTALVQASGLSVLALYEADYDGDGRSEAFAEMGNSGQSAESGTSVQSQFWFVTADGTCSAVTTDTSYWGTDSQASPHVIDVGTQRFITLSDYGGGSGATTRLYGVTSGSWYAVSEPYGMWISQKSPGTQNFEITADAYDAVTDTGSGVTTGHTYKTYYFYYNGVFHEYGAVQISGDQFLQYTGAQEILSQILAQHPGAQVDSILLRCNNLIHVNYAVDDAGTVSHYTRTLFVSGSNVTAVSDSEEEGTYQAALFTDMAIYSD